MVEVLVLTSKDSVDAKIESVKRVLQKLTCTYAGDKGEGDVLEAGDAAVKEVTSQVKDMTLTEPIDPHQYPMNHGARGIFVLFNVMNFTGDSRLKRKGSDEDADQMVRTFQLMEFEVIRVDDPKATEMVQILKTVADFDHMNSDCVAVGILTHGDWTLYKRDDKNIAIADILKAANADLKLEDLTSPFRAKNCHKSLKGKPKLFFIQACRGEKLAERVEYYDSMECKVLPASQIQGTTATDSSAETSKGETPSPNTTELPALTSQKKTEQSVKATAGKQEETPEDQGDNERNWEDRLKHDLPESMPVYRDFLVAWSTAPGYFSFRNGDKGSVFIQTLCRYLKEFHCTTDLLSILTWCNSDIAHQYESNAPSTMKTPGKRNLHQKKQMPWYFSRLTKEVIFTPKPKLVR